MLTRSHVEGFSYAIDTAAILLPFAPISMLDPLWPFGGQFYFLTRVATPALAVPFAAMAPGYGFAILSFLASLTLIVALPLLIRRWSGASWLAVVLAVFCVPILIEVNFFLNDNLIASTLFCLAALAALRTKTLHGRH
jgi:hypothetical protein